MKTSRLRSFAGLAVCLLLPSTDTAQKYLGTPGMAAYLLLGGVGLGVVCWLTLAKGCFRPTDRQTLAWFALTLALLTVAFAVIYPIADAGLIGGGSDQDDALNLAAHELLHGGYPYYPTTYLNNPIAPLPGAILLAVPFVLLGNSSYQNLFWLAVLGIVAAQYLQDRRRALLFLWLVLLFSPSVMQQLVTGGDHVANPIYVLVFLWATVSLAGRPDRPWGKTLLAAVLLGVGLASRANFLLLIPLLTSALIQVGGWRNGIKVALMTCITSAVVVLPFWCYDPEGFTPLYVQSNKLAQWRYLFPAADLVIPLSGGILSVALSFQRMDRDGVALFRSCAAVQAFLVLFLIVLSSLHAGRVDASHAGYGLFFLFFGGLAFWKELTASRVR
jgi:hypothetical protein